jgi:osomolarity two-component system, sensor histidine kinase SLN1
VYLQAAIYPSSASSQGVQDPLVRVTGSGSVNRYALPYTDANGSTVMLGSDDAYGYPPSLYPNLTFPSNAPEDTITYIGDRLNITSTLVLGPLFLAGNTTLLSFTVPILNNTSQSDLLGWMTVICNARNMYNIVYSRVGLGKTGEVVVIGPDQPDNLFAEAVTGRPANQIADVLLQFKVPPYRDRHPMMADNPYLPFPMKQYPAVLKAWSEDNNSINNAGHLMLTENESGAKISVGYARVASTFVDWVVVFGQSRGEVMAPINSLRNTVLICVFSVIGAIIIVCFPLAHWAVKPIRALRDATENSVMTYEAYVPSIKSDTDTEKSLLDWTEKGKVKPCHLREKKKSFAKKQRSFQIPQKVPESTHIVHDELTDLTGKFNEMADELSVQYAKLEDRVKVRTAELEQSRNEAQAANESKTLFIANVSHELRTPLNGIIGMCAVAMQEESVTRIRQSLKIIYKSSDLLLHLLNDLLTFSRSSFGQQLTIENGTFRLLDVGSQLVSIFEKQAKDADVGLKVVFLGPSSLYPSEDGQEDAIVARQDVAGNLRRVKTNVLARAPADIGPLREIGLRGDKNRILQILMNLVSNSLKFTPAKGQIEVRIRCKAMVDMPSHEDMEGTTKADSTTEQAETPASEVPIISIRKASENPFPDASTTSLSKGLLFDFEVEDTGPGIPEHLQQEIFKPFVQGDVSLSKKHGGTGLGLAICSQLAQMMDGEIKLKSTIDVGSTFTLTMPLKWSKEAVPSVSGSLARSGKRNSFSSSVQFETFSVRSGLSRNPPRGQTQSARTSILSSEKEREPASLDHPRLVGYTQPFLLDDNDSQDELERSSGSRSPPSRQNRRPDRPRLEAIHSVANGHELTGLDNPAPLAPAPVAEPVSSRAPGPANPAPAKPSLRVLVAEDNAVNQQVILRLLKLEKVPDDCITLAEDGEQALEAVLKTMSPSTEGSPLAPPYTLVFMDIQMPKMDGIEATKQIRALGFTAPIIALTAFDHETNRRSCDEAGMNAFLGKPIKRTALKKMLGEFGDLATTVKGLENSEEG